MIKHRNMDAPKLTWLTEQGILPSTSSTSWDDHFIDELKRALTACKVFLIYPVFWLCYSQFSNNFVSQGLQMASHDIPNGVMQSFDPAAIAVFVPIVDRILYPSLSKLGIRFNPISRITVGFWVMSLVMMYAAIIQHVIYTKPYCFGKPLCSLIGIAEIFAAATGYEYAYTFAVFTC